ncbi:MAG: hypothetical protein M3P47_04040 [Pseudomonadota bacterium]|nr:hypothetical protein [Pseudomonadota bacterium]
MIAQAIADGKEFVNFAFSGPTFEGIQKNGGAGETTPLDRTREGCFEIIEMCTAKDCGKLLLSALKPRQGSDILMPSRSIDSIHILKFNQACLVLTTPPLY